MLDRTFLIGFAIGFLGCDDSSSMRSAPPPEVSNPADTGSVADAGNAADASTAVNSEPPLGHECSAHSDCVIVATGDPCACSCSEQVLPRDAAAAYEADRRQKASACVDAAGPCACSGESRSPCCQRGKCIEFSVFSNGPEAVPKECKNAH